MKNKAEQERELEEIIGYYGSLEVYNEEQRRCALATIETATQANPFTPHIKIENAIPVEVMDIKPVLWHFWLKLFGQKA